VVVPGAVVVTGGGPTLTSSMTAGAPGGAISGRVMAALAC
jgi:hypothetical protein